MKKEDNELLILQKLLDQLNSNIIDLNKFLENIFPYLKNWITFKNSVGDDDTVGKFTEHLLIKNEKLKFNTAKEFLKYMHKFADETARFESYNPVVTVDDEMLENLAGGIDEISEDLNPKIVQIDPSATDKTIVKSIKERISDTGLTVEEFCKHLNLSRSYIYQLYAKNSVPVDLSKKLNNLRGFYSPKKAEYEIRKLILEKIGYFSRTDVIGIKSNTLLKNFRTRLKYSRYCEIKELLLNYTGEPILKLENSQINKIMIQEYGCLLQ